MGLDLTAAEVARCFERAAAAAGSASFEQAIEVLASLYAAASGASLEENRRLVGQLLRKGPSAVQLLAFAAETLRQRTDDLHQRYNLSAARLVAALMRNGSGLLRTSPYHLLDLEQALRKELDCDALYAKQLLGMILESGPLSAGVSVQTLRQRTEALVEVSCCLSAAVDGSETGGCRAYADAVKKESDLPSPCPVVHAGV